ncbi:hypothetical protein [Planctomicrobium sp. SH664]|uniref:hypothetical protein n=1 Tax=Planctomicrobium sp. SH664 TaxID=3448125 RepID=UPI003F5B932C
MSAVEVRKQISIFLPVTDWKALRQEAARLQIPITELCRRWIGPEIESLRRQQASGAERGFRPAERVRE